MGEHFFGSSRVSSVANGFAQWHCIHRVMRRSKWLKYKEHFGKGASAYPLKPTVMFVALVLCVLLVLAAPSLLVTVAKTKNPAPGRYIVTFKNDVVHSAGVSSVTNRISSQSNITWQWDIINGFTGAFTNADLEVLRSNPNIAAIEEDGFVRTKAVTTQ